MSACFIKRDRMMWLQVKGEIGMNWEECGQKETVTRIYFVKNIYFQLKTIV